MNLWVEWDKENDFKSDITTKTGYKYRGFAVLTLILQINHLLDDPGEMFMFQFMHFPGQ